MLRSHHLRPTPGTENRPGRALASSYLLTNENRTGRRRNKRTLTLHNGASIETPTRPIQPQTSNSACNFNHLVDRPIIGSPALSKIANNISDKTHSSTKQLSRRK